MRRNQRRKLRDVWKDINVIKQLSWGGATVWGRFVGVVIALKDAGGDVIVFVSIAIRNPNRGLNSGGTLSIFGIAF